MSVLKGAGGRLLQAPSFAGRGSRERRWPVRVIGQADRRGEWSVGSWPALGCLLSWHDYLLMEEKRQEIPKATVCVVARFPS